MLNYTIFKRVLGLKNRLLLSYQRWSISFNNTKEGGPEIEIFNCTRFCHKNKTNENRFLCFNTLILSLITLYLNTFFELINGLDNTLSKSAYKFMTENEKKKVFSSALFVFILT